ncbi:MAG: putative ATP-dependent transporter SufC [Chlamydiia bacterium]|nr:putative ATP-dependent transporter SufC [Chlamydiia bacterium]MCH9618573.1 putative ATP-dependent transporter SufC [Chlamydiia bacterium]MCH9623888.1 putative ATP-dependent transporter SufC [Chlamydiia bacterium]
MLNIKDLEVKIEEKEILKKLSLSVEAGKVYVIMGPNGAGKSTLSKALSGHPSYDVEGEVEFLGEEISELEPDERAKKGLFVSFQYPLEIPGISFMDFLYASYKAIHGEIEMSAFREKVEKIAKEMDVELSFLDRGLNDGCSGGEKKKNEILQMKVLNPKCVILDETDSGLDIDALKVVASGVNAFRAKDKCIILITHYQRLLDYIKPDVVFVMKDGKIVKTGDKNLALELEEKGYSLCS